MRIAGDPATLIRQGERAHLPSREIDNAYISDVMRVNCRDRRVSFSFASDRGARVAVVAERSLTRFDLGLARLSGGKEGLNRYYSGYNSLCCWEIFLNPVLLLMLPGAGPALLHLRLAY